MDLDSEIIKRKKGWIVTIRSPFTNGLASEKIFDFETGRLLKYYVIDRNNNIIASQ